MKAKMFEDLLESVHEGGRILSRPEETLASIGDPVFEVYGRFASRTSLSQSEFASLVGVSVKTVQNWE